MRILFMGTPEFAVSSLQALVEGGHTICGVFTRPDQKKNRGMKLLPTPVKEYALSQNIDVYQPQKIKDQETLDLIQSLAPELIVVAAYGRILPKSLLDLPEKGCINVHSSLLPAYRGSAPIHWAMLNGDSETGVTIMHMVEELDAGDIITQRKTLIDPNETVETLYTRLAEIGGELLAETVIQIAEGIATRTPQEDSEATFAPMLTRELSPLLFDKTAQTLHNQIRGLIPWPATSMELSGEMVKVFGSTLPEGSTEKEVGTILSANKNGIDIACAEGTILRITELQAQGKRRMSADDYLRGNPIQTEM